MEEKTIFPREEHSDILFQKILNDPWACEKLQATFCDFLFCNDEFDHPLSPEEFSKALFESYKNRDLSAFLMGICQNTIFDLLRNSFLIPYRFNADGKQNPIIMTDEKGLLLPEYDNPFYKKEYSTFQKIYHDLESDRNIFLAQAYRYSHDYGPNHMNIEQKILEITTGILLIRELPDTVKLKETEAEAYAAVWDIMIALEKELPMAYVFYGQDTLVEHNKRYDEIGIFLPNSHFLKHLEKHIENLQKFGVPVVVTLNAFVSDTEAETAYVEQFCKEHDCEFALAKVWEKGGEGGIALANKILETLEKKESHFHTLYSDDLGLKEKIETVAKEIYGADGVTYSPAAERELKRITDLGMANFPVCMAKTQYSLSDDAKKLGRPTGFKINVREVYVSAGAGFVVAVNGSIMTLPGLPKKPAAYGIDVNDDGVITGLF